MCGIAGFIDWERDPGEQKPVLQEMATLLSCRGPDAEGFWVNGPVAFAHRRLIVVDPAGGGQPMERRYGEHRYVIVYNGELYNTEDLRQQLIARGHTFQAWSDTEVLLVSYIEWGRECLERLNGIFAFAIWDESQRTLFLARDRLGVKPLFFAEKGDLFVFGSELKAVLAHPAVEREVDAEGLAEIFAVGPARTPGHGVLRGVEEVLPGAYLSVTPSGVRRGRYWRLKSCPHVDDLETTARRVRELLEDTVTRQLVADVPVVTFLSGGLDSSAVTAFAAGAFARQGLGPLHTYAIEFAEMERYFRATRFQTSLDGPWARKVSEFLGTTHHVVVEDTPELVEYLLPSLRARDLPGMADVDTSLYLFSREIKQDATVALSGEAADEVFGGYPWLFHEDAIAADTFPWSRRLRERIRILSPEVVEWIRPEEYVADRYHQALAEVPTLPGEDPRSARMREMQYLNISRFLPTLLDRKDRMSMAVGLEVRVPFCDHRLVEYVWNIPWSLKTTGDQAKGILRRALAGVLPEDVLLRRKSPYPSTPNPSYGQTLRPILVEILNDPSSHLRPFLNMEQIQSLTREGAWSGDLPWFGQLMGIPQLYAYLIQVEAWFREYRVRVV